MFLEHLHGQRLHHLPGQPIPVPYRPFREKAFPNIQPESPLVQLEAIPSCPITVIWEKRLAPTSPQHLSVVESNEITPEPPPFQTEQSQLPQLLLLRFVLQTPYSFVALL